MRIKTSTQLLVLLTLVFSSALFLGGCTETNEDAGKTSQPMASETGAMSFRDRFVAILEIPDRMNRVESLIAALRAVSASDIDQLRGVLNASDIAFRDLERVLIVTRWAQEDPARATEWALRSAGGTSRSPAIREAVYAWALRDPEAVVRNHDVESVGAKLSALTKGLVEGWFDSGIDGLSEYIVNIGDADVKTIAIDEFARVSVARQGAEATIAWADNLTVTPPTRKLVYRGVAAAAAKKDPALVAKWCDRICASEEGKTVPQFISRSWGRLDGSQMMTWLLGRPDTKETWIAGRIGFREFMIVDEENAFAWMEATTAEQRRMRTLQGPISMYANLLARDNPVEAFRWTDELEEGPDRKQLRIALAVRWLKVDEAAAQAWIDQSDLSEEDRAKAREIHAMNLRGIPAR